MKIPDLRVFDLRIEYGSRLILDKLSFEISSSGFFVLVGKNGCGKSSILKAINGEIPHKGEIQFANRNIEKYSGSELAGILSYLPQKLDLGINMTVFDLVMFGRIRFSRPFQGFSEADHEVVQSSLEKFGLTKFRDKYLSEISGGERQLAWMAQILAQDTPFMALDEPTLNLDLGNRKFVFDTLNRLCEEEGKSILLVTHELEYLHGIQGFGINLSENNPLVKKLDSNFLTEAKDLLEKRLILQ